ncbi:anthrone oxygenase family protein [Microbacterium sp. X-17]|uniref:anthrone oxygenase family protein n=1 Tax=Microbacterium sp. X-17 TaxID=3144404 RepID=UPI0031F57819
MHTVIPTIVLAVGLVLNALMAGLYFAFSTAIVPGLARTEDRAYVTSMQRIDESIENPLFLTVFAGALVVPVVAVFLHLEDAVRGRLPWIIAGTVLYGMTVIITGAVNRPLNKRLRATGNVTDHTASAVRSAFQRRWIPFHTARTALSAAGVIALTVAIAVPIT